MSNKNIPGNGFFVRLTCTYGSKMKQSGAITHTLGIVQNRSYYPCYTKFKNF